MFMGIKIRKTFKPGKVLFQCTGISRNTFIDGCRWTRKKKKTRIFQTDTDNNNIMQDS